MKTRSIWLGLVVLLAATACGGQDTQSTPYSAMDDAIAAPQEVEELWPSGMALVHEFYYEQGNVGAWISTRDGASPDEWCLAYLGSPDIDGDPFPLFGTSCTTDQLADREGVVAYLLTERETIDYVVLPDRFRGKEPVFLPALLNTDEISVVVANDQVVIVRYTSRPGLAPSYPGSEGASFKVMYSIACDGCSDPIEIVK